MTEATAAQPPETTVAPDGTSTTLADWSRSDRVTAATAFLETIYETETDHDDAVIGVHHLKGKAFLSEAFGFDDLDEAAARLVDLSDRYETYYRVGRCRPGVITEFVRGSADDTVGITALQLDLDIQTHDGTHSHDDLPTLEQAQALLAALPLQTFQVWSGGGIHAYVLLSEELNPAADDLDLLQRWRALVLREAKRAGGYHVDRRPLADPAAVLRVPGTLRRKTVPPTVVVPMTEPSTRYTLDEVSEVLPDLSEVADIVRGSIPEVTITVTLDDITPVWTTEPPTPKAAEVLTGWVRESLEKLASTPIGGRHDAALLAGISMGNWVGGDVLDPEWATAAIRAAQQAGGHDVRGHQQTVADGIAIGAKRPRGWDYLRVSQPMTTVMVRDGEPETVEPVDDTALTGTVMATSLTEAIATGAPFVSERVPMVGGGQVYVRHAPGTKDHGTWTDVWEPGKDGAPGQSISTKVANYWMWQARERARGDEVVVQCEVITSTGSVFTTPYLSVDDASSPRRVINTSRARGAAPPGNGHPRTVMESVLLTAGADERVTETPVERCGLHDTDDGVIWAGPVGSVTAQGVTTEVLAEPLILKSGPLNRPAVARMGYDQVSDEVGEMVAAWRAISTDAVTLTLLGLQVAAFLALSSRASVLVIGATDSGKSLLARLVRAWQCDAPTSVKSYTLKLTAEGDTVSGAAPIVAYAYDSMVVGDDLRTAGSDAGGTTKGRTGDAVATLLTQDALSGDGSLRGTQDGSGREGGEGRFVSMLTAERLPTTGEAITNRCLMLTIAWEKGKWEKCTLALQPGGPLDTYRDEWANTGRARAAMARVVQYICALADDLGGVTGLSREMDKRAGAEYDRLTDVLPSGSTRAVELAAVVSTGLSVLREALAELGQEEFAPTVAEVDAALTAVVTDSRDSSTGLSPGEMVIEWVRSAVGSHAARIAGPDGGAMFSSSNAALARACGWGEATSNAARVVGLMSKDRTHVVLTDAAIDEARRALPELRDHTKRELQTLLLRASVPDTRTDGGHTVGGYVSRRVRGYVVPAERLDLDPDAFAVGDERPAPSDDDVPEDEMF